MKTEILGRQKQDLSEDEKKEVLRLARDKAMMTACTKLLEELHQAGNTGTSQQIFLSHELKRAQAGQDPMSWSNRKPLNLFPGPTRKGCSWS